MASNLSLYLIAFAIRVCVEKRIAKPDGESVRSARDEAGVRSTMNNAAHGSIPPSGPASCQRCGTRSIGVEAEMLAQKAVASEI